MDSFHLLKRGREICVLGICVPIITGHVIRGNVTICNRTDSTFYVINNVSLSEKPDGSLRNFRPAFLVGITMAAIFLILLVCCKAFTALYKSNLVCSRDDSDAEQTDDVTNPYTAESPPRYSICAADNPAFSISQEGRCNRDSPSRRVSTASLPSYDIFMKGNFPVLQIGADKFPVGDANMDRPYISVGSNEIEGQNRPMAFTSNSLGTVHEDDSIRANDSEAPVSDSNGVTRRAQSVTNTPTITTTCDVTSTPVTTCDVTRTITTRYATSTTVTTECDVTRTTVTTPDAPSTTITPSYPAVLSSEPIITTRLSATNS